MDSTTKVFLTIDAGGTFLKSAVLNREAEVICDSSMSMPSSSDGTREEILYALDSLIKKGMDFISEGSFVLEGIGLAFPGPFNIFKSTPLMKHKFQAIYGMNLDDYLRSLSFIPDHIRINFMHDTHAVLSGEIWKGNARGFDRVALVTLGTGLGFAISEEGQILCNDIGGPLISIFKQPFKNGILEDYLSRRGFLKIYKEMSGNTQVEEMDVSDLCRWADQGEENSLLTFHLAADILADNLQDIITGRNIECLLLGGQISRAFHHMEQTLTQRLDHITGLKKVSAVKSIDYSAFSGMVRGFLK